MKVLDQYAGQTGPCAVCAKTISIPEPSESKNARTGQSSDDNRDRGVELGTLIGILGVAVVSFSVLFLLAVLIFRVGLPAIAQMRTDARNKANQQQIAKLINALNAYHDTHGTFPPAYFLDDKGKPAHSWRVMILPQLGYQHLYDQYKFDEAWNSAHNVNVTMQMPSVFRAFDETSANNTITHFAAVVGNRSIFPRDKSVGRAQALDAPEGILTIVELNGIGLDWTDPTNNYDIDSPQGTMIIRTDPNAPASTLSGNVGMLNGDTYHFHENTSPVRLQALATRSGSEPLDIDLSTLTMP
ncbi:DUF1559 domain-containing protein [Bremerella cremea]|uniref:DUF1559 family PulG-like putative transporter n=1 Tax=Bremerella cremea TaxID=1031537 RepID=UPI0031ECDD46